MSATSKSSPVLVILSDSDSGDEDECKVASSTSSNVNNNMEICRRSQENPVQGPSQQQQIADCSANSSHFLKEIYEIVQWVNTGVKREESCEKTFMEKKFDEMEKALEGRGEQLEQAHLEICVLKQIKTAMERENKGLKQQLEMANRENVELNGKWMKMKETFQALQSKYFEEMPEAQNRVGDSGMQRDNGEPSFILRLKQERMDVPVSVPVRTSLLPVPLHTSSIVTFGNLPIQPGPSQALVQNRASEDAMEEMSATTSTANGPEPEQQTSERSPGQEKRHGFDESRQHEGAVCLCGLQFSSKRTLDSHIIYFTCEKKFSCSICHKRFVGSNYLKGHMLRSHKVIYTGGSNGCRDCGETFGTLLQLRQHKKLAHPVQGAVKTAPKKKTSSGQLSASTKNRRSVRMRRRHQKGVLVTSALKMLQGNCSNCQFCREQHKSSKHNPVTRNCVAANAPVATSGSIVAIVPSTSASMSSSSITLPSPTPPVTRNATRALTSLSRSSSTESISFTCEFCQKWFGDDKSGLMKHQQICQKTR